MRSYVGNQGHLFLVRSADALLLTAGQSARTLINWGFQGMALPLTGIKRLLHLHLDPRLDLDLFPLLFQSISSLDDSGDPF